MTYNVFGETLNLTKPTKPVTQGMIHLGPRSNVGWVNSDQVFSIETVLNENKHTSVTVLVRVLGDIVA